MRRAPSIDHLLNCIPDKKKKKIKKPMNFARDELITKEGFKGRLPNNMRKKMLIGAKYFYISIFSSYSVNLTQLCRSTLKGCAGFL